MLNYKILIRIFDFIFTDCKIKFNKSGTSGKGANMISKHDIKLCNRLNSNRVLDNVSVFYLYHISLHYIYSNQTFSGNFATENEISFAKLPLFYFNGNFSK